MHLYAIVFDDSYSSDDNTFLCACQFVNNKTSCDKCYGDIANLIMTQTKNKPDDPNFDVVRLFQNNVLPSDACMTLTDNKTKQVAPLVFFTNLNCDNCDNIDGLLKNHGLQIKSFIKNRFLLLGFNRNDNSCKACKNTNPLQLDETIHLNGVKFWLRGVAVHCGKKSSSGHYVALIQHKDEWWVYDDNKKPKKIQLTDAVAECGPVHRNCVMALYEKY